MDHFQRGKDGALWAEEVALAEVAARFGTPTYVYSRATLTRHVQVLRAGMGTTPHHLCYAVKANANSAVLEVLAALGCDFDAVSVGELARVRAIGVPAARVILSGVGKRDDEIAAALQEGVRYISVESSEEMDAVGRVAASLGKRAAVSVRVNPDIDAKTHPYISTGLKENKFGVPLSVARQLFAAAQTSPHLELVGVTCHIGSQITDLSPFRDAATRMAELTRDLVAGGAPLRYVGMGGGLGIPYAGETPPPPERYGAALTEILGPTGLALVLEPGRVIVGNAGVLLSRVVRVKHTPTRTFVLLDAGMNDLIRPALYEATHAIEPVGQPRPASTRVDVVGPVCESADTFARDIALPELAEGDLVVLRSAGAYGFAMASTYNGRPRPAEIMCDGTLLHEVRAREAFADLWHGERRLDGTSMPTTFSL